VTPGGAGDGRSTSLQFRGRYKIHYLAVKLLMPLIDIAKFRYNMIRSESTNIKIQLDELP